MARNSAIDVTRDWGELTADPVVALTVQNRGSHEMEISPIPGNAEKRPQGLVIPPRTALINRSLSDLFPGAVAAGVASRLYARAITGDTMAWVSHV